MKTLCDNYSIIKNGYLSKFSEVDIKRSNQTENFLKVLYKEGMIRGYKLKDSRTIKVLLKYINGTSVIQNIKKVSSPSRSIYFSKIDIDYWKNKTKHDFLIISCDKGVISSNESNELHTGGKVLCIIS